jgi:CRISPR type IV-associated DEAD/DEAH-box helicase Csf4
MAIIDIKVSEAALTQLGWDDLALPERLKKALREALRLGLPPTHLGEEEACVDVVIAISGSDEQRLRAVPLDPMLAFEIGSVAAACIETYARHKGGRGSKPGGHTWIVKPRAEQKTMCRLMAESHAPGDILFLEASTGVGKGRAVAAHAAHLVKTNASERVVIAAPTIEILGQLFCEYKTLKHGAARAASMIGSGEFVSEVALRLILDSDDAEQLPDVQAARAWLKESARRPWGKLQKNWLCDSLADAAPGFPINLVRLTHYQRSALNAADDGGLRAYLKCAQDAAQARVVFVTHTMLALDVVQRLSATRDDGIAHSKRAQFESDEAWWHADLAARAAASVAGLIPNYDTLLVDEAHLLEQSFSNAVSDQISLFALKNMVDTHGPAALRTTMRAIFEALVTVGKTTDTLHLGVRDGRNAADQRGTQGLAKLCRAIARHQKSVKDKATRAALQEFRHKFRWLERDGSLPSVFATRLYFTPSRRYPLVERSKLNVNRELSFLWKYVRAGVLASATLYMHTASGYALHDMRKELRVPAARARAMRPICPAWVTKPVTVYLPPARPTKNAIDDLLVPPKFGAELTEWAAYYDRIAAFINGHWSQRVSGGTLMLMTSFEAIDEIGARLKRGPLADRVMVSERRESFRQRASRYLEAVNNDRAPIWLATGRAWTGLNLRTGSKAADDHAIDYLVMPRLPVLLNCSAIHRERVLGVDGPGAFGGREIWQCARFVRQGIGRAVRQRGVPAKEIFVLDGRLSWVAGGSLCSVRGTFSRYGDPVEIKVPAVINACGGGTVRKTA